MPETDRFSGPPAQEDFAMDADGEFSPPTGITKLARMKVIWISGMCTLLILSTTLTMLGTTTQDEGGVEAKAQQILATVKKDDPEAFLDLVVDYQDLIKLGIDKVQGGNPRSPDPQAKISSAANNRAFRLHVWRSFTFFRQIESRLWGFRWDEVVFSAAKYEVKNKDGTQTIPRLSIEFTIPDDKREYLLIIDHLVRIDGHWQLTDTPYGVVRDKLDLPMPDVVKVTGLVTYDGKPLADATVAFHPHEQNPIGTVSRVASAMTDTKGAFSLVIVRADYESLPLRITGVHPGKYSVTVKKHAKIDYPQVAGPPPPVTEETAGVNKSYLAAISSSNEEGSIQLIGKENQLNDKFDNPYASPLEVTIAPGAPRRLTFTLLSDGTGSIR
jgi:hypothetical protein